jgi:predicted phage gp36 major capsid-like protein
MEMTLEKLKEMVADVVTAQVEEMRKAGTDVDAGQVRIASPSDLKSTLEQMAVGFSPMGNGYIVTEGGSIINTVDKQRPWVKLSQEMEDFANGMKALIKSAGRDVHKVLEEQSDPSGGYLVPEEFQAVVVQYDTEPAICWPRATIWPMATDKLGMPKLKQRADEDSDAFDHFAGVSFTWTDEGGEKAETEPEFEFLELIAHELSGYTEITDTLIEDSAINIMNFITQYPTVLVVNRQAANSVQYQDLLNMDSKLPSVFDSGAIWFANKKVLNNLRGETDTNGQPLLQQFYHTGPGGVGMRQIEYLLGYPVVRSDGKTYALGTKGDIILGNWTWYYIGDRRRFTMDASKHYQFRNNKTALRVCGRLDGQAAIPEAFVVLDSSVGTS